jgi:hypothetical protein
VPRSTPRTIALALTCLALLTGACATESDQADDTTTTTTTTEAETTTTTSEAETTTTTEATPDVDVPDGFQLAEGDGILVAVPSSWLAIDLADGEFEALLDEAVAANPDLDGVLDEQVRAIAAQGAVFFAIEVGDAEFATNANIIKVPGAIPDDASELDGVARQGIAQFGGDVQDVSTVDLPAGEALRVTYDATLADGAGGTIEFSGVQFYVLADAGYVITVSFPVGADTSVADVIAETFTEV